MAAARMPPGFYKLAAHHLPPEHPVGPDGGRPLIEHRLVLKTLWFVLASGSRWEDVPPELGCSGRTARHYLQLWEGLGCWTGCTPTCSGCSGRRASWTRTWWSWTVCSSGPSAAAGRPARVPWTAGRRAPD